MRLTVTGHRPNKLFTANHYTDANHQRLVKFSERGLKYLQKEKELDLVNTGMALGFDTAIAEACVNIGMPFIAFVPFVGQESKWPQKAQARYQALLAYAEDIVLVSKEKYSSELLQDRNELMVESCDMVMALWDGSSGGTCNCVRYANQISQEVWNVWDNWLRFRENN